MIKNAKKICIIGGPGTGKSTLAKNLEKELNLPAYHIDGIHHLANWKIRDKEERDKIILDIVEKDEWIIDGTYKKTLEKRIQSADITIFLDYHTLTKIKGIFSRYLKHKGEEKPEIPGCKEKMDWKFIKDTMNWNKRNKDIINEILEKNKNKEIIIFKNRKKLNKWYEEEFNRKIEV